jgi:membrane associated rhomboid family serine protease
VTSEQTPTGEQVQAPTCYRHPGREAYIRCTRCDRTICPDCMRPASVGFQCPECVAAGNRTVRQPRTVLGGRISGTDDIATKVLIGINVAVFVLVGLRYPGAFTGSLITPIHEHFALIPRAVQFPDATVGGVAGGEYYRMITAAFLHYGLFHIGLNMYALWLIGRELERVLGVGRYVALYLISAFGGSVLTYVWADLSNGVVVGAGASGAIFGLFAAYFIVLRRLKMQTGGIATLIGINLLLGFVIPGIGWQAHVGGMITGAVVATVFAYAPRGRQQPLIQLGGAAAVLVLLVIATLANTAYLNG